MIWQSWLTSEWNARWGYAMSSATLLRRHRKIPIVSVADEEWPRDGVETLGACPVCKVAQRRLLHRGLRDVIFHCAPGAWDLWRCGGCRNAYLDPRPSAATIVLAYGSYYTHIAPPVAQPPAAGLAMVRRALANGYRNWRYGATLKPASAFGIPLMLAVPAMRDPIDLTLRYLPKLPKSRVGRVLDVGCGNGAFLEQARAAGWIAEGCDFDPTVAAGVRSRGFDIREGGIEAWAEAEGEFDAITFSHVIEHVHDPIATLKAAWRLLRENGTIYIDTPNVDSAGHRAFGRSWRGLEPPRHLVLFTWAGMRAALATAGFHRSRRVARPGVYGGIAAQSAAIRAGRDPALATDDRTWGSRVSTAVRAIVSSDRTEFVTLVAIKRGA